MKRKIRRVLLAFRTAARAYVCAACVCVLAALFALPTEFVLTVPASAFGENSDYNYVLDAAGLLDDAERASLNAMAEAIETEYGFGAYVLTVDDYQNYSDSDVETCAEDFYLYTYDLGVGEERSGLLLMLSMAERDYALFAFGYGNTAFTDAGKGYLASNYFLHGFRDNNWYRGFSDYFSGVSDYLREARDGYPVDDYGDDDYDDDDYQTSGGLSLSGILMLTGIPSLISGLICLVMGSRMKTVHTASTASSYVPNGGFRLRTREDTFTHTTESRVKIESDHDSGGGGGGGTTIRSSGGSSSSGKF